jgi:hypothetical protein
MRNSAVFILTRKRPFNQKTFKTLERQHYTGKTYFLLDDTDPTISDYIHEYGEQNVKIFNRGKVAEYTDSMDNFTPRTGILYSRQYSYELARDLGIDYFLQLDDDYTSFQYRYPSNGKLKGSEYSDLDRVFETYYEALDDIPLLTCVAFAQGGDLVGGQIRNPFKRKAMNGIFCKTDRIWKFSGTINEDVNGYITNQQTGSLCMTYLNSMLVQTQTQSASGGMTDIYVDSGTYVKSFYSVIANPAAANVSVLCDYSANTPRPRFHHNCVQNHYAPKIIPSACLSV